MVSCMLMDDAAGIAATESQIGQLASTGMAP